VHFYRNVFSHVPASKVREVSHMLKAIHAQETRGTAEAKASAVRAAIPRPRTVTRVSRHGNARTGALSSRGRSAGASGVMASFRAALAGSRKTVGSRRTTTLPGAAHSSGAGQYLAWHHRLKRLQRGIDRVPGETPDTVGHQGRIEPARIVKARDMDRDQVRHNGERQVDLCSADHAAVPALAIG
jgi:hypothetical protein